MNFNYSTKVVELQRNLQRFMDENVYPNEKAFHDEINSGDRWQPSQLIEDLKAKAKSENLWNLFLPEISGLSNLEYAPLAEIMGKVVWASEVFNCSAPDTGNMEVLERYGTAEQKETWLKPLLNGEIRSCFSMTEPEVASSDATNIGSSIVKDGDSYVLNGRKWWSTGAGDVRCKLSIFMGKTDPNAAKHVQQSMVLVPMDAKGVKIERILDVFGFDDAPNGHAEITFDNVRVPAGKRRGRVALLQGCAQQVLAPRINQAAINVLTRHGIEVVLVKDEQCCGALTHHLGHDGDALARARGNVSVWQRESQEGGLDAILVTASGCGTVIKDYGFMLREDGDFAGPAAQISALTKDITEYLAGLDLLPSTQRGDVTIAYHSACSLQHGQKITQLPKELLSKNGFVVKDVPESHLCCGSAGTYNILQPDIASRLRDRKVANIATVKPDMIAAGNIGCMVQIAGGTSVPVVHTVELLDWATGGTKPGLRGAGAN